MAATLNKVFLMGNLTRDPDRKQTPNGDTVTELGLAVSEQFRSRATSEVREVVTFVDVTVWGKVAENCAQYLTKGRPVFVEGRLVLDQWEDKKTGEKRSRLRVRADRVQFLTAPDRAPRREVNGAAMGSDWAPTSAPAGGPVDNIPPPAPSAGPAIDKVDPEDLPF